MLGWSQVRDKISIQLESSAVAWFTGLLPKVPGASATTPVERAWEKAAVSRRIPRDAKDGLIDSVEADPGLGGAGLRTVSRSTQRSRPQVDTVGLEAGAGLDTHGEAADLATAAHC